MRASKRKEVIIAGDQGRFVCGRPWSECHAELNEKVIPISEELMASTIWWWRNLHKMPDDLTKTSWLQIGVITTGARHEWRLLWESTLFFYEIHARLSDDGFLFDHPARFLSRDERLLLSIAEMQMHVSPLFIGKFPELIIANLHTAEGKETAFNAILNRKSGHRNTARARKGRPWHLIEVLDKQMLLSPAYVPTDAERSGLSKVRREYLKRCVIYSSISSHGKGKKVPCKQDQRSTRKAPRKTP